jgi:hypothetical protein
MVVEVVTPDASTTLTSSKRTGPPMVEQVDIAA